ncbi:MULTISPECIES: HK97 family phage prohead protease [unclassified Rhodococcus (in: high G+C Gram-positive bacteria)]|uniref:HK97 family phage prohead protease n=1 Tax=unclassified Rhodococcus (in: high G+C Gram-positive bacteria) TaxID=192944 RepID=UPI0015C678D5|nr:MULTISPECIES: HK97 family phage prohead protease [unclassified Rhodococcus (in: high G+C Gram-positive bacteria)]
MTHTQLETRTAAVDTEVEIRSAPVSTVDEQTRIISGIAVPYGQATEIRTKNGSYLESFALGVFEDDAPASVHANHSYKTRGDLPIGTVISGKNRPNGYYVECRIANTVRGDEVLELARDGVLKYFSVGFRPGTQETRDGVLVRTKAALAEVSITEIPAYKGAVIESVRNADTEQESRMDPEELARLVAAGIKDDPEVTQLRTDNAEMIRRIGVLEEGGGTQTRGRREFHTRSGGELLKALAAGDADKVTEIREAMDGIEGEQIETRAYTGQVVADGVERPAWLEKQLRLTNRSRPMSTFFSRESLPADGNSFEYAKVIAETGAVTVQAAEGDDLAYLEIKLGVGAGTVRTVGGYTSFSRQAIERSKVPILDTGLRWMGIQYAEAFDLYVRAFSAALPTTDGDPLARTNVIPLGAAGKPETAPEWISVLMDAAWMIDDNSKGLKADGVLVSRDVAKGMALIEDSTGRPVFNVSGDGQNTWAGSFDLGSLELVGEIAKRPVFCIPQLPAGYCSMASREAVTTMESAGAPFSLQDENIINLTKDFSLYGYQGIYSEQPKGITRITWDA